MATVEKIVPNLWCNGNAKEMADFYVSVFKDGKIISTSYYPTEGLPEFQQSMAGKELAINLEINGMEFVLINAGDEFSFSPAVSFAIICETQEEIDYYWDRLSAVPEAEKCGWLQDKFGLSWQVTPRDMDNLMSNPAAYQAMMSMKKIVIADLKAA